MPMYEYSCSASDHRFERIRKISDAPLTVCPDCGGSVEKLISSPAIQFKGSGFYIGDYGEAGLKSGWSGDAGATKAGAATDGSIKASRVHPSASSDPASKDSGPKDSVSLDS